MKTIAIRTLSIIIAAGSLSAIAAPVSAKIVAFTAEITEVPDPFLYADNLGDTYPAVNPFGITVGDTFSCWAEYDDAAVTPGFNGFLVGTYSVTVGSKTFTHDSDVGDYFTTHGGQIYFENGSFAGLRTLHDYFPMTINYDNDGSLPLNPNSYATDYMTFGRDFAGLQPVFDKFYILNGAGQYIRGQYVVPIPAALPLLGSALAVLVAARRKVCS